MIIETGGNGRSKETSEEGTAEIQEREKGDYACGRSGGGESENAAKKIRHTIVIISRRNSGVCRPHVPRGWWYCFPL